MSLQRILAATDFSVRSERALQRAALLCRQFSAQLQLLHVVDDDHPAEVVERETAQALALLERTAAALREAAGTEPSVRVSTGDTFPSIIQAADDGKADLVTMGSHRKRILGNVFVGTTIERVMRCGHHPVLMVNTEPSEPYRRVIVAIDMSEASANALRTARALGLLDGAYVTLLHVFQPFAKGIMIYGGIEREQIEDHAAEEAARARRALTGFVAGLDLEGLRYDVRLEEGQTFYAIKEAIECERPDLLVLGTRGLTGAKRVLLGSVADALLRGVECDLLAVPPAGAAA